MKRNIIKIAFLCLLFPFSACKDDKYLDWKLMNEKWLANNLLNDNSLKTTTSGIQYKIINQGYMRRPNSGSEVLVTYKGELIDGTVFDSQVAADLLLSSSIKGWQEIIPKMNGGGTYVFYLPYSQAYGSKGTQPTIPPYSTLKFTVTLIDSYN